MGKNYFLLPLVGLLIVFTMAGLTACGDFSRKASVQPAFESAASTSTLQRATKVGSLYISSERASSIAVYGGDPLKFVGSIKKGLSLPVGLAFNSLQELFVTNQASSNVSVYDSSSGKLVRTLSTRFTKTPFALAVAPDDDVYVLSRRSVTIFTKGQQAGSKKINEKAEAIAIDTSGNAYLATNGSIDVFAPGGTQPTRTITDGVDRPIALAIDGDGNLYVSNMPSSACGNITVYNAASGALENTIIKNVCHPLQIAFDSQNNAYVGNSTPPTVNVFSGTTQKWVKTISNGISTPGALLFDPSGNLYVINQGVPGNVLIFPPGHNKPSQTLTRGIDFPADLAPLP
jgi:DNA-binding beta-propeller fold protein YncE